MGTSKSCSSSVQLHVVQSATDLSFRNVSAWSNTRLSLCVNMTYLRDCGIKEIVHQSVQLLERTVFEARYRDGDTVCKSEILVGFYLKHFMHSYLWWLTMREQVYVQYFFRTCPQHMCLWKGTRSQCRMCYLSSHCCPPSLFLSECSSRGVDWAS